jgi:uncharacterized protein YidB (DUF937 family)
MGLLDGMLGGGILGGGMRRGGGMSPITMAILGLLAYRAMKGANPSGASAPGSQTGAASGGLGGLLGGLLGGGTAGGILSGGLGDLLKQFQDHGHGDKAESWVSSGPNKPVSQKELEESLGSERLNWLMQQTGMSREELLAGLSQELPKVVDNLTPQGRIPTENEASRLVA